MKIIIELDEGERVERESASAITISDALQLFAEALRGVGYVFTGEIELVDGEESEDLDD